MGNNLLLLKNITLKYKNQSRPALSNINFSIRQNNIFAVLGENGSGKTSLLRAISGLEHPCEGEIYFSGNCVYRNKPDYIYVSTEKRKLGLVFQESALFPHFNVRKNIEYGLNNKDNKDIMVSKYLDLVQLSGKDKRFPHELSGGERQKIAIARALASKPNLLLLDEPFSNLDPSLCNQLRSEIYNILKSLNQTALIITHNHQDVMKMADRVAILKQGKIIQEGTPKELYTNPINKYCAERFGPINEIFKDGEKLIKRPEDVIWLDDLNSNKGIEVIVKSITFLGYMWEIIVQSKLYKNDIICYFDSNKGLNIGDKGRITWK